MAPIYYSPALRRQDIWLVGLAGAMILIPLGFGAARLYYGFTRYGPVAASVWSAPWLLVTLVLFTVWLAVSLLMVKRSRFGVVLYRNGLRLGDVEVSKDQPDPQKFQIIPWEDVSGIAVEMIASAPGQPPSHRATLYFNGGKKLNLAEALQGGSPFNGLPGPVCIENLPELITRIKARLYTRLHPELEAAFLSGKLLSFGPVSIQRQQLQLRGRKPFSWSHVRRVTIHSGDLVVELDNPKDCHSFRIPVSKIPNLEILLSLIHSFAG